MENKYKRDAYILKAFCDESRLKIIDMLKHGEMCACTLLKELTVGQPTLSHHMKILVESEIVTARKQGKWTYYSLSNNGCENAKIIIMELLEIPENSKEQTIKCCVGGLYESK